MPRGAKPGERRGGRQKGSVNLSTREMKAKAQGYGDEALDILMEIARDTNAPTHERIMAAEKVLDRGYGKPAQQIKTHSSGSVFDWDKVPISSGQGHLAVFGQYLSRQWATNFDVALSASSLASRRVAYDCGDR